MSTDYTDAQDILYEQWSCGAFANNSDCELDENGALVIDPDEDKKKVFNNFLMENSHNSVKNNG